MKSGKDCNLSQWVAVANARYRSPSSQEARSTVCNRMVSIQVDAIMNRFLRNGCQSFQYFNLIDLNHFGVRCTCRFQAQQRPCSAA